MNTYTWRIDKFSDVTEKIIYSDVFKVGNVKWKLFLYPKGNNAGKGTHLSIYLEVFDPVLFPDDWRIYANFKLRVNNQSYKDNIEQELDHWFNNSSTNWGFSRLVQLNELHDSAYDFLVNDILIVEVEISMMGALKHFI